VRTPCPGHFCAAGGSMPIPAILAATLFTANLTPGWLISPSELRNTVFLSSGDELDELCELLMNWRNS
jgi:hypothetical protein